MKLFAVDARFSELSDTEQYKHYTLTRYLRSSARKYVLLAIAMSVLLWNKYIPSDSHDISKSKVSFQIFQICVRYSARSIHNITKGATGSAGQASVTWRRSLMKHETVSREREDNSNWSECHHSEANRSPCISGVTNEHQPGQCDTMCTRSGEIQRLCPGRTRKSTVAA